MSITLDNKKNEDVRNLILKIPKSYFRIQMNDRERVVKCIKYLQGIKDLSSINSNILIREVISKHLRMVNMKMVDIDILLLVGLNKISIDDISRPRKDLVNLLISENKVKNNLDTINRCIAQIKTKLPFDLKERMNFEHTIAIKHLIYNYMKTGNLLEQFTNTSDIDISNIDFSKIDTTDEVNWIHMNLDKLRKGNSSYESQQKQQQNAAKAKSKEEKNIMNTNLDHINIAKSDGTNAFYIDIDPILMEDEENNRYYYDEHSKSLVSLDDQDLKGMTLKEAEKVLSEYELTDKEMDKALKYLSNEKILDEEIPEYIDQVEHDVLDKISIKSEGNIVRTITIILICILVSTIILSLLFNKKIKKK